MSGAPHFLARMEAIAAGVDEATIAGELGEMCRQSFFYELRRGARFSQERVDAAERAFTTATERLMPAELIHEFIVHGCAIGIMPRIDQAELVPGFTSDESFAGGDAAARLANPAKKFTQAEVLACLRWNRAAPEVPVAIAHLIDLLQTYAEGLCELVAARSPAAAEVVAGFAKQWSPKNVLKFLNAALFVCGRAKGERFAVDQALAADAMNLLNRSGAFHWQAEPEGGMLAKNPLRIHCPAQPFLHKLVANQGSLIAVIDFVAREIAKKPCDPDVEASIAFMREVAEAEEAGIRAFGQDWSRMKLAAGDPG